MTILTFSIENAQRFRSRIITSRIFGGLGANVFGQAVNIIVQLGTVPLLLSLWGAQTFGLWLVISAIPSYLALADFGFSSAANNVMTLATARGAYAEANRVFHSLLALNAVISTGLSTIAIAVLLMLPNGWVPHTAAIGADEVRIALVFQTLQVALTLTSGALMGAYQSSGRYANGYFQLSFARLSETLALILGAFLFRGFVLAAGLMLAARFMSLAVFASQMRRGAPWLSLGFGEASVAEVRRLVNPALALVAQRAGFAISLQGFILAIGATLSLSAVAAFSSARTLTRSLIQVGGVLNMAILPELTRAYGAGDFARVRRLIRLNFISVLALNIASFVAIALLGNWFLALWTRGKLTADPVLLWGLAGVACLNAYWMAQANLILSINRHESYSYWLLGVSAASVAAAVPCAWALGVDGLLLPLLTAEAVMIAVVVRAFRQAFATVYETAQDNV